MAFKIFSKKTPKRSSISKLRSPYREKPYSKGRGIFKKRLKKEKKAYLQSNRPNRSINKSSPLESSIKRFFVIILTIFILGATIFYLFFSDYFLVKTFRIIEEGIKVETNETMNEIMRKFLGKNILLVSQEELEGAVRKNHPEINELQLKKVFPDALEISFKKFPPAANIIDTVNGIQKKYLIDDHGLIIEENSENPNLPLIHIETAEPLQVYTTILNDPEMSKKRLDFTLDAIKLFEEKFGIKILSAKLRPKERQVDLLTEKNFYVMFDMEKEVIPQVEKLKQALPKLDIYNIPLQYIDLRISGTESEKVIFKRR